MKNFPKKKKKKKTGKKKKLNKKYTHVCDDDDDDGGVVLPRPLQIGHISWLDHTAIYYTRVNI